MLPPIDIDHIATEIRHLCEDLAEYYADADRNKASNTVQNPTELCGELARALAALAALGSRLPRHSTNLGKRPEPSPGDGTPSLGAVCNNAVDLLARLAEQAGRLQLHQPARQIELLTLPLACWVARRGGELSHPAPVVNAAGTLANSLQTQDDLAELYGLMTEVIDALSPQFAQPSDATDTTRPWRVLLLTRANVATRSHRPHIMARASAALVDALPGDAPEFFREALGQMEALNYPPEVRSVVQRYADAWCTRRTLH